MSNHDFRNVNDLIYFMLYSLKLSKVDRAFLSKLTTLSKDTGIITSNQDKLFKHLLSKYKRQLTKHNIDYDFVISLPHKYPIVNSIQEVSISINGETIIAKSPFKKEFLKDIKNADFPYIEWIKDSKQYELPFNLKSLNIIKTLMEKNFNKVECCSIVKDILEKVDKYKSAKIWDPTLVVKNNQLLIYGINQNLYDAIKDISLELTCASIAKLVAYGINIDSSVSQELEKFESIDKIKIAADYHPKIDFDLQPNIFTWLKEFGCDAIYFNDSSRVGRLISSQHLEAIKKAGIKKVSDPKNLCSFNYPVILSSMVDFSLLEEQYLFKRIKWLSSKPIKL